jgi:hypothetical protein
LKSIESIYNVAGIINAKRTEAVKAILANLAA